MERSAVIIGVNRTGNLPVLNAAVASARAVEQWAVQQGFSDVTVITDEAAPVTLQRIKDAVKAVVNKGTADQLLVYFSGHGVNIRYGEYWLLTDAPLDPQAAVNVDGSVTLARQAGVPHVVMVSDACRTAADGIQAQGVTGGEIFPNNPVGGPERAVDLFFATMLGAPALELRDPKKTAAQFKALYTDVLVEALEGKCQPCLETVQEAGQPVGLVRPWPLRHYLETEVPKRLTAAAVSTSVFQTPDARITSPPTAWIARIPQPPVGLPAAPPPGPAAPPAPGPPPAGPPLAVELAPEKLALMDLALPALGQELRAALTAAAHEGEPFGPGHFESNCGFKLQGSRFVSAFGASGEAQIGVLKDVVVVWPAQRKPESVLLQFEKGPCTLLPAIPDFIASLTMADGELVNVVYEPSDSSWRWVEYQNRIGTVRKLRAQVAAAARFGVFRLEGLDAGNVAREMQLSKGYDPTMAIYAAYAYHALNNRKRLNEMLEYMQLDLNLQFFDVALLAGALRGKRAGAAPTVLPSFPMLAQGWAQLNAFQVEMPPGLASLQKSLASSLWTLFDASAAQILRAAFDKGEIH